MSETATTLTNYIPALKTIYSPDAVENETYADNPLHALLKKDTKFYGQNFKEALIFGNPQGRSADFATAQNTASPSSLASFLLTRVSNYSIAAVSNELIEASANDAGALLKALTTEIDGAMRQITRSLCTAEYGDGTGALGIIGTITNPSGTLGLITLTQLDQITNFEVGMTVAAGATVASQTMAATTISAIDRQAGQFTVLVGTSGVATQTIFVPGDANAVISGLAAWLPVTAPTATTFFGQDRSLDTSRLGGVRSDGTGKSIDEALIDGAADVGREGGSPDYCFMDFLNWRNLIKTLGAAVRYVDLQITPKVGFQAVEIMGPKGKIKVIPDRNCPNNLAYLLSMRTWTLRSLGMCPKILESDGNKMLRMSTADGVEVRIGYYAQLGCSAPGYNAVVKLS